MVSERVNEGSAYLVVFRLVVDDNWPNPAGELNLRPAPSSRLEAQARMSQKQRPSPDESRQADVQSILVLRKLTRAVADARRAEMLEYLSTLTPLLRPKSLLGDYIQGGPKESIRRADKAFQDLQAMYDAVAVAGPFKLSRELKGPIDMPGGNLEITPLDYPHVATSGGDSRTITVRSPLTWVLTYGGFAPSRLKELLETKNRSTDELQRFVLSYLVLHLVMENQPGVTQILNGLHCPVRTTKSPDLGELPITVVGVGISTSRASDDVILQSAELTGMDAFEEVVNVADIPKLREPLKDRLIEIVRGQAPDLLST